MIKLVNVEFTILHQMENSEKNYTIYKANKLPRLTQKGYPVYGQPFLFFAVKIIFPLHSLGIRGGNPCR